MQQHKLPSLRFPPFKKASLDQPKKLELQL
jgi:hypothetical protein